MGSRHLRLYLGERLGSIQTAVIDDAVHLLDGMNLLGGESAAVETDRVDAAIGDRLAGCDSERRYILVDLRAALYHHVAADMAELMNKRTATDDGEIVHLHLAGELGTVRHDDMVMQDAVMRHVAVSHDEVIIADDGLALAECTAVNGNELTQDVIVADEGPGLFAVELQILRDSSDDSGGEDMAVLA